MFVLGLVGPLLLRPWSVEYFWRLCSKTNMMRSIFQPNTASGRKVNLRGKACWEEGRRRKREFTTNTSYFGYLIIHIVLIKPYSTVCSSILVIFDFTKIFFNYCRICTMYHTYDWTKILDIRYYPFLKGHNLGDEKKTIISIINTSTFLRWQNKCHIILEPI